jgi:hypothetical protein
VKSSSEKEDKDTEIDPHKSEIEFCTSEDVGLALSCVTCSSPTSSSFSSTSFLVKPRKSVDCFHVLEGTMVLTPSVAATDVAPDNTPAGEEDLSFEIASGDTVVLPKGWTGRCKILEPIKALRVRP